MMLSTIIRGFFMAIFLFLSIGIVFGQNRNRLAELKNDTIAIQSSLQKLAGEINDLNSENNEYNRDLEDKNTERADKLKQIESLRLKFIPTSNDKKSIDNQILEEERELSLLEDKISEVKKIISKNTSIIIDKGSQKNSLENALKTKVKDILALGGSTIAQPNTQAPFVSIPNPPSPSKKPLIQTHTTTNNNSGHTIQTNKDLIISNLNIEIDVDLAKNEVSYSKNIQLYNNSFDSYVINLNHPSRPKIKLFWKDDNKNQYYNLKRVIDEQKKTEYPLAFATNGGMYNPRFEPQGLLVQEEKEIKPLDTHKGNGNFYLMPNGVFLIEKNGTARVVTTEKYASHQQQVDYATQSGPMLVIDGEYHEGFNPNSKNRRTRSGVGVMKNNKVVFIISKQPVTFYQFASIFKEIFNCDNALFLDGSVSRMYCPELGRFEDDGGSGGGFGTIIGINE